MRRLASVLLAAAVSAAAAEPAKTGTQAVEENTRSATAAAVAKAAQPKQPSPEEVLRLEHNKLLNDLLVAFSDHGDMCDEAMAVVAKLDPKPQKFALDAIRAILATVPDALDGAKPEAIRAAKLEAVLLIVAGAMRLQAGVPVETVFKTLGKPNSGN